MNKFKLKIVLMSLILQAPFLSQAQKLGPLFYKGEEIFKIVDEHNKTPKFRILNSSPTKKTFALAVNSVLNLGVHEYVDIELQKFILRPVAESSNLVAMFLMASGKEYKVEPNLKKADLRDEKYIDVKVPTETSNVAVFNVTSRGTFTLKYVAKDEVLLIQNAKVHFEIDSPLSGSETEQVQFSGRGLRQK